MRWLNLFWFHLQFTRFHTVKTIFYKHFIRQLKDVFMSVCICTVNYLVYLKSLSKKDKEKLFPKASTISNQQCDHSNLCIDRWTKLFSVRILIAKYNLKLPPLSFPSMKNTCYVYYASRGGYKRNRKIYKSLCVLVIF